VKEKKSVIERITLKISFSSILFAVLSSWSVLVLFPFLPLLELLLTVAALA